MEKELDAFLEHLNAEDDLAALLRGFLYVEAGLIQLIQAKLVAPEALDLDRLRFPEKVNLAIALGQLEQSERPALLQLNTLRNKVAHRLDHVISCEDVQALKAKLNPDLCASARGAAEGEGRNSPDLRTLLLTFVMAYHVRLSVELVAGDEDSEE